MEGGDTIRNCVELEKPDDTQKKVPSDRREMRESQAGNKGRGRGKRGKVGWRRERRRRDRDGVRDGRKGAEESEAVGSEEEVEGGMSEACKV